MPPRTQKCAPGPWCTTALQRGCAGACPSVSFRLSLCRPRDCRMPSVMRGRPVFAAPPPSPCRVGALVMGAVDSNGPVREPSLSPPKAGTRDYLAPQYEGRGGVSRRSQCGHARVTDSPPTLQQEVDCLVPRLHWPTTRMPPNRRRPLLPDALLPAATWWPGQPLTTGSCFLVCFVARDSPHGQRPRPAVASKPPAVNHQHLAVTGSVPLMKYQLPLVLCQALPSPSTRCHWPADRRGGLAAPSGFLSLRTHARAPPPPPCADAQWQAFPRSFGESLFPKESAFRVILGAARPASPHAAVPGCATPRALRRGWPIPRRGPWGSRMPHRGRHRALRPAKWPPRTEPLAWGMPCPMNLPQWPGGASRHRCCLQASCGPDACGSPRDS